MRAPQATFATFLAFTIVVRRGASAAPKPGLPFLSYFRGGAASAAVVPWRRGGGDHSAASASVGGSSVGSKTGKKKRRKRSTSSSSPSAQQSSAASRSSSPPKEGVDRDPDVPADIASSVGVPTFDGGVAAADTPASADSEVSDEDVSMKKLGKARLTIGGPGKMPSLFTSPDEAMYDRYSACLAATEGLRKARDASLSKGKRRVRSVASGSSAVDPSNNRSGLLGALRRQGEKSKGAGGSEEYKRACAQYVLQSSRVIRALGLSVSQFNQLGREVGNDPVLKDRVMEQAYLYRMAATLNMQKMPLIEDPSSEQLLKAHRRRRVQMFARSMTEIEELRSEQTERLKRSLNVDRLPDGINICDPSIQPLLSPKVRAVCEAFPLQAELIVKKYGLNSDEFNQMLEETRCNPIFRWRVKKYMGKSGEKPEE